MILQHRPATYISPELFSHLLVQGKSVASAFLTLMQATDGRDDLTQDIRDVMDTMYDMDSDKTIRD